MAIRPIIAGFMFAFSMFTQLFIGVRGLQKSADARARPVAPLAAGSCPLDTPTALVNSENGCSALPTWLDLFEEPDGKATYTVRNDDFERAVKPEFQFALSRLSSKLAPLAENLKAPFTIVVLGNSMTFGTNAVYRWSDRLQELMQQKGFTNVKVVNLAVKGGGATKLLLQKDLGLEKMDKIDVVLVDIAISDSPPCCGLHEDEASSHTQRLIRHLLQLPQQPAVVYLETFTHVDLFGFNCQHKMSEYPHMEMLTKYKVPVLNYNAAVCPNTTSDPKWGVPHPHPEAVPTHENIARLFAGFFMKEIASTCTARNLVDHPSEAFTGDAGVCKKRAFDLDASNGANALPATTDGSWCFYADKPDRPGWIATKGASGKIRFSFRLASPCRLTVRHIVSYENFGSATCRVDDPDDGERLELNGLDTQANQSYYGSATFAASIGAGDHSVTCESKGDKFKIVALSACYE